MGGVVADDQVEIESFGQISIGRSRDNEELLEPLTGLALGENCANRHIQVWQQGGVNIESGNLENTNMK